MNSGIVHVLAPTHFSYVSIQPINENECEIPIKVSKKEKHRS